MRINSKNNAKDEEMTDSMPIYAFESQVPPVSAPQMIPRSRGPNSDISPEQSRDIEGAGLNQLVEELDNTDFRQSLNNPSEGS